LIADFAWKRLIGLMKLDQVKDFDIIQVGALENEGLTNKVIRRIPQVLRGEGSFRKLRQGS